MKTLDELKKKGREEFSIVDRYFTLSQINQFHSEIDSFAKKVWDTAIEACKEVIPKESNKPHVNERDTVIEETLTNIESLRV